MRPQEFQKGNIGDVNGWVHWKYINAFPQVATASTSSGVERQRTEDTSYLTHQVMCAELVSTIMCSVFFCCDCFLFGQHAKGQANMPSGAVVQKPELMLFHLPPSKRTQTHNLQWMLQCFGLTLLQWMLNQSIKLFMWNPPSFVTEE